MLSGNKIRLRAVEPWDVDKILEWENDRKNWRVSNTMVPFSKELIMRYIENAQDIYTAKQIRLIMTLQDKLTAVGAIDLFDYEPHHQRAGVGILVEKEYRAQGFASEALEIIEEYALNVIGIRNLYCNILEDNEQSIRLFEKAGYVQVGRKIKWFNDHIDWLDELMYQKVLV
ncbi:GNAT family N-acetyltransferase [Paracrocinitomix mangrovi]|uniref:GNAT family N-acetyltransferase n=1 Tax=Paracrocinitomix mangrovi TaxID=2862509 RepID=UPI001EDA765D|nr:GNAT family protein [Paracrocinitomix mangrovi]UKN01849.1 GNAT family N-acetyltransferase [Paracrocinitomix mangrovi]